MLDLSCNIHASSFTKGEARDEYDDVSELQNALGLEGVFTFTYTYPLSNPAIIRHILTPDMNGEDLLVLARVDYETIYAAEEDPGHIPGMLNRAQSVGPYGIWGHDFSDLYFEGINIDTIEQAIKFSMGS